VCIPGGLGPERGQLDPPDLGIATEPNPGQGRLDYTASPGKMEAPGAGPGCAAMIIDVPETPRHGSTLLAPVPAIDGVRLLAVALRERLTLLGLALAQVVRRCPRRRRAQLRLLTPLELRALGGLPGGCLGALGLPLPAQRRLAGFTRRSSRGSGFPNR